MTLRHQCHRPRLTKFGRPDGDDWNGNGWEESRIKGLHPKQAAMLVSDAQNAHTHP